MLARGSRPESRLPASIRERSPDAEGFVQAMTPPDVGGVRPGTGLGRIRRMGGLPTGGGSSSQLLLISLRSVDKLHVHLWSKSWKEGRQ